MRKPRISLRGLILLVTAIGLFLGYSQWRRQQIIRRCKWYGNQGFYLDIPNDFRDWIWQRMPKHGHISAYNYGVLFHGPRGDEFEKVDALGQQWSDEFPEATEDVDEVLGQAIAEWRDEKQQGLD